MDVDFSTIKYLVMLRDIVDYFFTLGICVFNFPIPNLLCEFPQAEDINIPNEDKSRGTWYMI